MLLNVDIIINIIKSIDYYIYRILYYSIGHYFSILHPRHVRNNIHGGCGCRTGRLRAIVIGYLSLWELWVYATVAIGPTGWGVSLLTLLHRALVRSCDTIDSTYVIVLSAYTLYYSIYIYMCHMSHTNTRTNTHKQHVRTLLLIATMPTLYVIIVLNSTHTTSCSVATDARTAV